MKKLVVLLMAMLVAASAFAIVDEDTNSLGLYFDTEADVPCLDGVDAYATNNMWLVMVNPDFDELFGFEAGYTMVGTAQVLSTNFTNPQALNVGQPDNMIVGFGTPTETSIITTLAMIEVLYMAQDASPVEFTLHGTTPSSMDPAYPVLLLVDGVLIAGGLSTVDGPSAQINGGCTVVATEEMSFDSVKSLYR